MAIALADLVAYTDDYLSIAGIPDSDRALNGLQVEGTRAVRRLAAAVDASEASVRAAVEADCDLLLVHHGLFWDGNQPVTGRRYRRLAPLMASGMAVYSAHLPLDVHPEVGNNAVLARRLGLELKGRFAEHQGMELGVWGELSLGRDDLADRLASLLGDAPRLIPGGPDRLSRVGVLTGGGGGFVQEAVRSGLDALITGEGSHHTYFDAMEGGMNLYYCGHYATETFGVQALAEHLAGRFDLTWTFLDLPTGL
jgi:dinuclear metal center YbgI/SA1388 family protein